MTEDKRNALQVLNSVIKKVGEAYSNPKNTQEDILKIRQIVDIGLTKCFDELSQESKNKRLFEAMKKKKLEELK